MKKLDGVVGFVLVMIVCVGFSIANNNNIGFSEEKSYTQKEDKYYKVLGIDAVGTGSNSYPSVVIFIERDNILDAVIARHMDVPKDINKIEDYLNYEVSLEDDEVYKIRKIKKEN